MKKWIIIFSLLLFSFAAGCGHFNHEIEVGVGDPGSIVVKVEADFNLYNWLVELWSGSVNEVDNPVVEGETE
jgi:hypothetical protein